ncbi:MAG: BlaI/MecI/CopY family transcriptional regulator [Candidatus Omnitrophota bacterium]|jgi:predicted transcriptional regulator|nr:MAG: BlaI/MecI/CopY family transcriptional regulator [Candidatus Omnitrophota bacterium]
MKRKNYSVSEAEMEILRVLWERGPSTAKQVREHLPRRDDPAYSTVITLLQRMEAKGSVGHEKSGQGKAFVFHTLLKPEQVRKQAVRSLVKRYFENDPIPVFAALVESKKLSGDEIRQLQDMLDDITRQQSEKPN